MKLKTILKTLILKYKLARMQDKLLKMKQKLKELAVPEKQY